MNSCFLDYGYGNCIIDWTELFVFLLFLHLAMGTAQYYLTIKLKGENPKMALIPILSLYNLFKLSGISISSLYIPLVFITLCGLGYFIRFLDDGVISLEKMFSFILFNLGLPFWIIYLLIQIIKGILRTAHYRGRFGVLLFLLFGPLFLAYLTLTYDEILGAYSPPLPMAPKGSSDPQISQSFPESIDKDTISNPPQTSTANTNAYRTPPSNESDIGKAVVGFVGIIGILGILAFVIFTLFVLCIFGGPAACVIPGFWH